VRGERVLVAMSGGVDSSVAAALLVEAGHEVVGVTLKLWGGDSDRGCCSVADVDDARAVAARLGIEHHVFNFGDDFDEHVVGPYVADHAAGRTPNPCIECNRHLKFDRLLRRADALGFPVVATGHHARVVTTPDGTRRVARGADSAKDQSYVLHVLDQPALARVRFPVGDRTKAAVRSEAARLGLATADKPDSQDVCFITATGGRERFLRERLALQPAAVVDRDGTRVGAVPAVELVTLGQRRGLGLPGGGAPRYVVDVDVAARVVTVGGEEDLLVERQPVADLRWVAGPVEGPLLAQTSAHGVPRPARVVGDAVHFDPPARRVAPGQSVVLYEGDEVVAAATATATGRAAPPS
jgi:tRNA-specific 2-thiouridylase